MSGVWTTFAVTTISVVLGANAWLLAQATPPGTRARTTDFRPSTHGFAFRNSFPGYPPPLDGLDLPELPDVPSSYGLCGGMCFAAADYFHAGRPIPRDDRPPASGSRLHEYLVDRQDDSLGDVGEVVIQFLAWMANDDDEEDGVWHDTYEEMKTAKRMLGERKLAVLGLVIADIKGPDHIWDNHQVLAYGYSQPNAQELLVNVYDPNYPQRDDIRLRFRRVEVERGGNGVIYGYRTTLESRDGQIRQIRGAFVIDYESSHP